MVPCPYATTTHSIIFPELGKEVDIIWYSCNFGFDTMIVPRALRDGELVSSCDQSYYEHKVAQDPKWWDFKHDLLHFGAELMSRQPRGSVGAQVSTKDFNPI
jgi:hypothetical protein